MTEAESLFLQIGSLADFPIDTPRRIGILSGALCVVRTSEDTVFVLDDACPHEGASLSEGDVYEGRIECPLHGSTFELRSGAVRALPALHPVGIHEVRIRAGAIDVRLRTADAH